MSEHLDDNCQNWPKDAFELLQVPSGADKKTIRRAYNKLIKKFKPDHHPEEFRLIREAYEAALNQLEFKDFFTVINEVVDQEENGLEDDLQFNIQKEENEYDSHWEKALEGNLEEAFTGLREQVEQSFETEVVLRLYWMKKVKPSLPEIDFLPLLTRSYLNFFNYRISTLIFKEMEQDTYWSLSAACLNFIESLSKKSTENVRQLLEKRWLVVFEENKLAIIADDLETLRQYFTLNEEEWGLILLAAQNFLSFWESGTSKETLKKYTDEVQRIPINAGGYLDSAMDSFDYLKELRIIIQNDEHKFIDDEWREIISSYWAGSKQVVEKLLEPKIVSWVRNPKEALNLFDGMDSKVKPLAVSQVKKIVNSYAYQLNSDIYSSSDGQVELRIQEFINSKVFSGYFSDRQSILMFSIYQDVLPEDIISYIMENEIESMYWIQNMSKDIHESVYLAYKALMYV